MRSRYTAFALRDVDHALASWHPGTRPGREDLARSLAENRWLRLDVLDTRGGGPFEEEGTVEFVAIARTAQGRHELHEISRFQRVDGTWLYLDGTFPVQTR